MKDTKEIIETSAKENIEQILLVEDDEFHLELIERALSPISDQYEIVAVNNYQKALAALEENEPSVIVTDLKLPDGSALEFLSEDITHGNIPIIVITSQGNEELAVKAMKAGAMDYIVKSEEFFNDLPRIVFRTIREWELKKKHKKALNTLRESEERFRAIFETSTDLVAIKDDKFRYTHVNPAMGEFFGMDPSDMIGLTDKQLFGSEAAKATEKWDKRVLKGETVEEQHQRKVEGQVFVFLDTRLPLKDQDGEVNGIAIHSKEMTQILTPRKTSSVSDDMAKSPVMRETLNTITQVAKSEGTILLLGESGAGKDYLARWIHNSSARSSGPYFSINCAALAESLAESELFGHEKGAFTGAVTRKKGLVEMAEGGTLLLNEIGELPTHLQAKLLTFLDTMSFMPVGGQKERKVNVRIIAATHRDLKKEVVEGRFLSPLFYRLEVVTIRVPSLRERKEDIPGLVNYLIGEVSSRLNINGEPTITSSDIKSAMDYDWPGNVRELKNMIERSLMLWREGPLMLLTNDVKNLSQEAPVHSAPSNGLSMKKAMKELKRSMTIQALNEAEGNKQKAARMLHISRDALYRYIREYDIKDYDTGN